MVNQAFVDEAEAHHWSRNLTLTPTLTLTLTLTLNLTLTLTLTKAHHWSREAARTNFNHFGGHGGAAQI